MMSQNKSEGIKPIEREDFMKLMAHLNDDWQMNDDGLSIARSIKCKNFRDAFAMMTAIALIAERYDHHPDWHNLYANVDIRLTTTSTSSLSIRDYDMAVRIDALASKFQYRSDV